MRFGSDVGSSDSERAIDIRRERWLKDQGTGSEIYRVNEMKERERGAIDDCFPRVSLSRVEDFLKRQFISLPRAVLNF